MNKQETIEAIKDALRLLIEIRDCLPQNDQIVERIDAVLDRIEGVDDESPGCV